MPLRKRVWLWVMSHDWRSFEDDPDFCPVRFREHVQDVFENMRPHHARGWYWRGVRYLWGLGDGGLWPLPRSRSGPPMR